MVEKFHEQASSGYSDEELDELIRHGAPADTVARLRGQARPPSAHEVLPDNWPAVQLYLEVYGQFRVAPSGHILGFDYNAVDVDISRAGIEVTPDTWQRFKYLERCTCTLLNERRQ